VTALPSHQVIARNAATASENKIHDDAIARQYGFEGGLVPGVTVYAYLTHPVVAALGRDWLEAGDMSARFLKPCYDGDTVTIDATLTRDAGSAIIDFEAHRAGGQLAATATATLPARPAPPPDMEAYPHAALPAERPPASNATLSPGTVLGSVEVTFRAEHAPRSLGGIGDDLALYVEQGVAHPGALLTSANTLLTSNVRLGPWIHVGSDVTHFDVVRDGQRVETRGRVARCFERKGHRLVELDAVLVVDGGRPVVRVRHTAVWEPARGDRGAAAP
jgi:acyl dehydratase